MFESIIQEMMMVQKPEPIFLIISFDVRDDGWFQLSSFHLSPVHILSDGGYESKKSWRRNEVWTARDCVIEEVNFTILESF